MATGKKFYWLKLKVDFLNSEMIDYILSQKNGSDYLAIYLILCTKTINTNGELVNQLGEVLIPYDVEKIQRDCKHFHIDTIRIAMNMFTKLKLIYMQENGIMKINNYEEMVGYETDYAKKMSAYRKKKLEDKKGYNVGYIVGTNVRQENRDKRLEYRDIDNINTPTSSRINIYEYIEANFGRTLSPIEYQQITLWEDSDLTRYAIQQSVLNGKYNIKYIDTILKNYKSKNIQTVLQAQQDAEQFKNSKTKKNKKEEIKPTWFDQEIKQIEDLNKEQELETLLKKYE